jgi:hypothetical protein
LNSAKNTGLQIRIKRNKKVSLYKKLVEEPLFVKLLIVLNVVGLSVVEFDIYSTAKFLFCHGGYRRKGAYWLIVNCIIATVPNKPKTDHSKDDLDMVDFDFFAKRAQMPK